LANAPISKQVQSFLSLVRYLASFLPTLTTHTAILDSLTKKECDKHFPTWTTAHQCAFDKIKQLAISPECLITINPSKMPAHRIFITTDASDIGSGAILSFRPSLETAQLVAYDSRSFKGAELNYPIHEKELLAIIQALSKWCTKLLGYEFEVWMDHHTLEHFKSQKDLSC
jgi:reverse transcriptase-like protein